MPAKKLKPAHQYLTNPLTHKNNITDWRDVLFQAATVDDLLDGAYEGITTIGELKQHGDFGLGTFNGLDGEMVLLDGYCYQIKVDGDAHEVSDDFKTPFAAVTFFDKKKAILIPPNSTYEDLKTLIFENLSDKHLFYAIMITGEFTFVKARSVPKQEKPYQPLAKIINEQHIFQFDQLKGTLVGFWSPQNVTHLNVPGFHFHFLDQMHQVGGHLLDCQIKEGTIYIDATEDFILDLPEYSHYEEYKDSPDRSNELDEIEK